MIKALDKLVPGDIVYSISRMSNKTIETKLTVTGVVYEGQEVAEIKKSATFSIDYDHYQKIEVIQPQWVFERPTHQSGHRPTEDDLPWSSNTISNDSMFVRDIKKDTFVDKDEYVFDNDDVVF